MIQVSFLNGVTKVSVGTLFQWDKGQELHIYDADLTQATFQVHFSNKLSERAIVHLATLDNDHYVVKVPNELLEQAHTIDAFIYEIGSENSTTTHHIAISVSARKKPRGFISTPSPSQQSQFDEALAGLNEAHSQIVEVAQENKTYIDEQIKVVNENATTLEKKVDANKTKVDEALLKINNQFSYIGKKVSYYEEEVTYDDNGLENVESIFKHGITQPGVYLLFFEGSDSYTRQYQIAIPDLSKNHMIEVHVTGESGTKTLSWYNGNLKVSNIEYYGYTLKEVWLVAPLSN